MLKLKKEKWSGQQDLKLPQPIDFIRSRSDIGLKCAPQQPFAPPRVLTQAAPFMTLTYWTSDEGLRPILRRHPPLPRIA